MFIVAIKQNTLFWKI